MKLLSNINDIKRVLEVKDLLENNSIRVDRITMISEFLGIDRDTFIFIKNCYNVDMNYSLECNLTDEKYKEIYDNFLFVSKNFNEYMIKEIGTENLNFIKYETINDIESRVFAKTYRINECNLKIKELK